MKFFWIFIFNIFFSLVLKNKLNAQTDTLHLYQAYQSFTNEEKAEWTAFEDNWNYFEYNSIKNAFKIKTLNCKNCESLYADIYLEINDEGKAAVTRFIKGKKCGIPCNDALFMNQFENTLKKQQFKFLKNKQFIARFGHILKC
jgi:hypothetical protein